MTHSLEISDDLYERLDDNTDDGQSVEQLVEELLNVYETEGAFLQEGYSE
jgi:predicted CopG family antitoxin